MTNDESSIQNSELNTQHASSTTFPLPNDPTLLRKVAELIKSHPGENEVTIGTMIKKIDDEGLQKLQALFR